jgi:hypothetical protein
VKLEKPIQIPSNPFWTIFRTFGRDELLAGIISILATIIIEVVIQYVTIPVCYAVLCLAFAGPIFEKLGFFVGHFNDAYEIYSTTPIGDREDLSFYLKKALKGGGTSLFWDIILHDPIYVLFMIGGMSLHPETPAWLLVPVAFGISVLLVATIRVSLREAGYWWFKQRIFRKGFELEEYFEAKFFLSADEDPEKIITQLKDQFLPAGTSITNLMYDDIYYTPLSISEYNARDPRFRIRTRREVPSDTAASDKEPSWIRTAQIIYTRAVEHPTENDEQFRFFPTRKDKFYLILPRESHNDNLFPGLQEFDKHWKTIASLTKGDLSKTEKKRIKFIRRVAKHARKILISVDSVEHGEHKDVKFHVVEIKAYLDRITLLKEAMRFIMTRFNVLQTTQSKIELLANKIIP